MPAFPHLHLGFIRKHAKTLFTESHNLDADCNRVRDALIDKTDATEALAALRVRLAAMRSTLVAAQAEVVALEAEALSTESRS